MEEKIDWRVPSKVTDVDIAFPARGDELTPPYESIPKEFKRHSNAWVQFVDHWFSLGNPFSAFNVYGPVEGVNGDEAIRHLKVVLGTFATKHEHKIAGAAYLMSLWFEAVERK